MKRSRTRLLALATSTLAVTAAASEERPARARAPEQVAVENPAPAKDAKFGLCTCTLDFDGDGVEDLAVGAPGVSRVDVFLGPDYRERIAFAPEEAQPGDQFGKDIAAGEIDGRAGDDLIIGAPMRTVDGSERAGAVYLATHGAAHAERLPLGMGTGSLLGSSVAIGDFDADGHGDIAAGAPRADVQGEPSGGVLVYFPATEAKWRRGISNPAGANKNGNYGHDLAVADGDGDGHDDLFVSAVGNRSSNGTPRSGQVFVHFGPIQLGEHGEDGEVEPDSSMARTLFVEDHEPSEKDWSRFGMSIFVRDVNADGRADLLVGAPRKDGGGVKDAGLGFLFFGPDYTTEKQRTFVRPQAKQDDILGFRSVIADLIGGPEPDVVLSSLARRNVQALIVWDGAQLDAEPEVLRRPPGGSHHYIQGLSFGARVDDGRELLVLGDPDYAEKDGPDSCGRVLLQRH